jgi:hypothetical protein
VLTSSANETVALRAIKMKLDLALGVPPVISMPTEIGRALEEDERRLAHRISEIELSVAEAEVEGD